MFSTKYVLLPFNYFVAYGLTKELEVNPLNLTISPTRIASFVVLVIDIVFKIISPPLQCHWYLADTTRSAAEVSRAVLLHSINPVHATTSATRSKNLIDIISITKPLSSLPECRSILGDFLEYFLQIRLDSALGFDWGAVDGFLMNAFQMEDNMPTSPAVILSLVNRLRMRHSSGSTKEVIRLAWFSLHSCSFSPRSCCGGIYEASPPN